MKRNKKLFSNKFANNLKENFTVDFKGTVDSQAVLKGTLAHESITERGRPTVSYEEGSSKTKSRCSDKLASKFSKEQLINALIKKKISNGKNPD